MAKRQGAIKESHAKCAYCEADTSVVAYGDVEHYRPKSTYWWLAYTYDNYLFACQICNQAYKSDNFPIWGILHAAPLITLTTTDLQIQHLCGTISPDPLDVTAGYKLYTFVTAHFTEKALLLNPYFDDPFQVIAYAFDDDKEEVAIVKGD